MFAFFTSFFTSNSRVNDKQLRIPHEYNLQSCQAASVPVFDVNRASDTIPSADSKASTWETTMSSDDFDR